MHPLKSIYAGSRIPPLVFARDAELRLADMERLTAQLQQSIFALFDALQQYDATVFGLVI